MTRTVLHGLGYAVLVATAGYSLAYRFSNPTLTETQLFLAIGPLTLLGALVGILLVCGIGPKP
jgi:hypothetical protein